MSQYPGLPPEAAARLHVSFMGSRTHLPLRFIHCLLVGWAIPLADVYFDPAR